MSNTLDISFVIPVKDEEKTLEALVAEIASVCQKIKKTYEIIFIDDGSTDNSLKIIKNLNKKNPKIHCFKLRRNCGKSIALSIGFAKARGKIVFTMDADLQDNPANIPDFLQKLKDGYDLVSGWRKKRKDPLFKILSSWLFNFFVNKFLGIKIHDIVCGFKAYNDYVLKDINLYGELFRFIPVLANQKGYQTGETVVKHRPRKAGKSKYTWFKAIKGFLDFLTILFLTSYSSRPGHFFGILGIVFFIPGLLIGLFIFYLRLVTGGIAYRYPLLLLGALLMIVGVQFISTGLLAEMVISSRKKATYSDLISDSF